MVELCGRSLVCYSDIVGFSFPKTDSLFCLIAAEGERFREYGIAEGSLLLVEPHLPYEEGKLNVFLESCEDGIHDTWRLSLDYLPRAMHFGQVIAAYNRFV